MDRHGKIMSPMRGINRNNSKKPEFLRSKNQSTLVAQKDEFNLSNSMYKTTNEFKSHQRMKEDRSAVDQIWTSESMVANAMMANQGRQLHYSSQERPQLQGQPTFIKQLIENQFMADHIQDRLERDRVDYLDNRLLRKPRIFKHHTETNSN